jgi:hypothetical protein
MGLSYADINVENLFQKRRMAVKALIDSGSVFFTVPEHLALQLGFDITKVSTREVIHADGSRRRFR